MRLLSTRVRRLKARGRLFLLFYTLANTVTAEVEEEMDTDDSNKVLEEEPDEEKPGKK